jgi:hypothetical protein
MRTFSGAAVGNLMKAMNWVVGLLALVAAATAALAAPPAQKLPSALVVLPLLETGVFDGVMRETRIELVNLANQTVDLQCFFVYEESCNEIGFFVTMTPFQPVSWLASTGFNDLATLTRVPPFVGRGEMKCAVLARRPEIEFHNVLQARAIIFGDNGQTVAYSATAFRRLSDGDFTGLMPLDGVTYEQCPEKLHFTVIGERPGISESKLVLVPCTQDLFNQIPSQPNVQFTIINEFEQAFSAATRFKCFHRSSLTQISNTLARTTLGTDIAHLVIRSTGLPVIGLVIDHFTFGVPLTAGNDPSFEGGRSATVTFP